MSSISVGVNENKKDIYQVKLCDCFSSPRVITRTKAWTLRGEQSATIWHEK